MLNTFLKGVCAFTVATTFLATSANAEDQTVKIMDLGYFPVIVNADVGDTITFTNNSEAAHTLAGPEDSWVSDPIPVNGSFILTITEETPATYSGASASGEVIEGSFSYELAETDN